MAAHSTPILRRPELVVRLGTASAQLERPPAAAGTPCRPPGHRILITAAIALLGILILGPIAIVAILGPTAAVGIIVLVWYGVLILLPMLTYAAPALWQQWLGRGRRDWLTATSADTGRTPLLCTELAAWRATGGGSRGHRRDGFELVKAIAAEAARDGAILVGTARTAALPDRYRTRTNAVASPANSLHLRWP